jgi:integrase
MEQQVKFQTKVIMLDGGERFPIMLERSSGLPVGPVTDWALDLRGKPIATTKRKLSSVALLYEWATERKIDIEARILSRNLFSAREMSSLSEYLYGNKSNQIATLNFGQVVGATHRARIDNIIEYIVWRSIQTTSTFSTDDPRVVAAKERLKVVRLQLEKLRGNSVSTPRGLLTEEQCEELFEIMRPGSPRNPFQKRTQLRNYVIMLMLYELGARRSEPLTVKGRHVSIGRPCVIRFTFTPNDPADPRLDIPSIKTKSRDLPVSLELARSYETLLKERRSNPKTMHGAKRTEFIFLSTKDGKPLSKKALDDIFVVLRQNFPTIFPPSFAAHHLRRTWNYNFSKACEAGGIDKDLSDKIHRYFMGWSPNSKQTEKYNERFIMEMAMKIGLAMQDKLTGGTDE